MMTSFLTALVLTLLLIAACVVVTNWFSRIATGASAGCECKAEDVPVGPPEPPETPEPPDVPATSDATPAAPPYDDDRWNQYVPIPLEPWQQYVPIPLEPWQQYVPKGRFPWEFGPD